MIGRPHALAAAFVVFCVLPGAAPAEQSPPRPARLVAQVDEIFAPWKSAGTPGCAVAVGENGATLLSRAYGMADLEHDVPNTPATIFEAGSVSKQFTATAVLLLAQQGKLSLADDVRKHLPELPEYGKPITLDHLIHHTSGLRDWGGVAAITGWPRGSRIHTHAHVLDIASRQKALNYETGAEYSYTNTGYNLLAVIVERVSGKSFAELTRQYIFEPLGMKSTSWRDDFTRVVKGRAIAYASAPDGYHSEMPFENVHGNGGLLTTVGDLLLWNENFVHGRVGGPALLEELQRRGRLNDGREIEYAGGLFMTRYQDVPEASHTGATAGYRAFLARYPEQHLSIAVLCNQGEIDPRTLAHRTADLYLAGRAAAPAAAKPALAGGGLPQEQITVKAGLYRNRRTGEPLRLELKEGALTTGRGLALAPLSGSEFQLENGSRMAFEDGPNGAPAGLRLLTVDGDAIPFDRVADVSPVPEELAEYVGEYASEEAEVTYRVVVEEGKLVLRRKPDTSFALSPLYADGFEASIGWLVRFVRDPQGKVSELSFGLGRVRDLRLARVK